jgi:uncharacterized membrane protein YdjX (TVP38/TMEM64 family)
MLFWIARRTVRDLTRTRRCGRSTSSNYDLGLTTRQSWIILAVLSSPLWIGIGFILIVMVVNAATQLITQTVQQHNWALGALLVLCVLAPLAALCVHQRHKRQALIDSYVSPRVSSYYPCCGMPEGVSHATTCPTFRQPPDNPAKYSNRR